MTDQNNDREEHEWMITHEDHSYAHKFYRDIECSKCGAAQKIEYPSGEVVAFEGSYSICPGAPDENQA